MSIEEAIGGASRLLLRLLVLVESRFDCSLAFAPALPSLLE